VPQKLAKVLNCLESGDVLVVTRLDRLARSTRDLLNILDTIGKAGAGFKSLGDAWADTTTPHARLMLTVLGGLAEFERELILARTAISVTRRLGDLLMAKRRATSPAPTTYRKRRSRGLRRLKSKTPWWIEAGTGSETGALRPQVHLLRPFELPEIG
jgi:DNA invertase Pin-like site-specific DNA recombinase